jgi:hypothetical protein
LSVNKKIDKDGDVNVQVNILRETKRRRELKLQSLSVPLCKIYTSKK